VKQLWQEIEMNSHFNIFEAHFSQKVSSSTWGSTDFLAKLKQVSFFLLEWQDYVSMH
jgi:hypothetical protein